jgi:hypothetical protein
MRVYASLLCNLQLRTVGEQLDSFRFTVRNHYYVLCGTMRNHVKVPL